jgi:hypothetical protein
MSQRIQRIAITGAGAVATIVLASGLVAAGFGPQSTTPSADTGAGSIIEASTSTKTGPAVETVYVKPAPAPKTVVVRRAPQTSSNASSATSGRAGVVRGERDDEDRYERDDD